MQEENQTENQEVTNTAILEGLRIISQLMFKDIETNKVSLKKVEESKFFV